MPMKKAMKEAPVSRKVVYVLTGLNCVQYVLLDLCFAIGSERKKSEVGVREGDLDHEEPMKVR